MTRRTMVTVGLTAALGAALVGVPAGFASRTGSEPQFSGGPAGFGWNCTTCHTFGHGDGSVELLGMPRRYQPGEQYDLTIRVSDADQLGAGFEISAESVAGHEGFFLLTDPVNTTYAGGAGLAPYVTQTNDGVDNSVANWAANGGSYEFDVLWVAPASNDGPITFFVAGNAINDAQAFFGDSYYSTYVTSHYALAGDGDGDTDLDLADWALLQNCFGGGDPIGDEACVHVDLDGDESVTLDDHAAFAIAMTGPTSTLPAAYVLADSVRGGRLYDKWWLESGIDAPSGDHPLYPPEGAQSGSSTFRCKECHGWDYKGQEGAYGAGSHYTGIGGVFGSSLAPQALFDLLKADPVEVPDGHDLDTHGMTDADLWDVVKMTLEGTLDTDTYIDETNAFIGDAAAGANRFASYCAPCHGIDGTDVNFGSDVDPEYVGTVASHNPWEFLHKVRFAHPASPMIGFELLHWSVQEAANVGVHAATLPTE